MNGPGPDELSVLLHDLQQLRQGLIDAERLQTAYIDAVKPRHRASAINLIHYVELRSEDVRELQGRLAEHGLSSLGRTESHVLPSIDAVIQTLLILTGEDEATPTTRTIGDAEVLTRNAVRLLGPQPADRTSRIMVTLPPEAASDPVMVGTMLESGMDIARINCAHDDAELWTAMIANLRAGEEALGQKCLVSMDLAGPKLRTGPVARRAEVRKLKPVRDEIGQVLDAGRAWLGTAPQAIPLRDEKWARSRRVGDEIQLVDARGAHRVLRVEEVNATGCLVSCEQTVYFVPGTTLTASLSRENTGKPSSTEVGALESGESAITVHRGDHIILTKDLNPVAVTEGSVHRIGSTLFEVFADTRPGERVLIDDGKISTVITQVAPEEVTLEVLSTGVTRTKLRAEKGINLPDSTLTISALTKQDVKDIEFVKHHADIVEMSFVRSAADVSALLKQLDSPKNHALGIVFKIETVAAFEALPQILLEAMRWDDIGVMIARGDLAVEAGFERLAELQEEILWIAEAAHVPVIWATEVLDDMARTGIPSRAEVTDAAMAERAECVMLNKGPYIVEAIAMLADILRRMKDHMQKKRSLLRRLKAWELDGITRL